MKSLTLLLMPLLFLASCTIDWNDSKDAIKDTTMCTITRTWDHCSIKQLCNSPDWVYDSVQTELWTSIPWYTKLGTSLLYFQNTDDFPIETDLTKSLHKKGYIYTFNKLDCQTGYKRELVSSRVMLKVLNSLPENERVYWPYIFGWDVFDGQSYSFFGNILRFPYVTWSEQWWDMSHYDITINTHTMDNSENWSGYVLADAISIEGWRNHDNSGNLIDKFSTWFYLSK